VCFHRGSRLRINWRTAGRTAPVPRFDASGDGRHTRTSYYITRLADKQVRRLVSYTRMVVHKLGLPDFVPEIPISISIFLHATSLNSCFFFFETSLNSCLVWLCSTCLFLFYHAMNFVRCKNNTCYTKEMGFARHRCKDGVMTDFIFFLKNRRPIYHGTCYPLFTHAQRLSYHPWYHLTCH
jgi:hypothetical protein